MGMALFDDRGLGAARQPGVRGAGRGALVDLSEASAPLRALLNWVGGAMAQPILPGGAWVSTEGALPHADGARAGCARCCAARP